jgi:hypothetical protein
MTTTPDAIVWRKPASTRCPDVARSRCGTIVGQRPARIRMRDSTGTRVTLLNSFRSGSAGFNDRHCRNYLKLQIAAFVRRRRTMIAG